MPARTEDYRHNDEETPREWAWDVSADGTGIVREVPAATHAVAYPGAALTVAAPGTPLTDDPDEDVSDWRIQSVPADAGFGEACETWARVTTPAEIVRDHPALWRWVGDTGVDLLLRLNASIVRPGDVVIDEERAARIQHRMDYLREQLAEAFPKTAWKQFGLRRPPWYEPFKRLLRRRADPISEVLNQPPASCIPRAAVTLEADPETAALIDDLMKTYW